MAEIESCSSGKLGREKGETLTPVAGKECVAGTFVVVAVVQGGIVLREQIALTDGSWRGAAAAAAGALVGRERSFAAEV